MSFTKTCATALLFLSGTWAAPSWGSWDQCAAVDQVTIAGINTNTVTSFGCPSTTCASPTQEQLQAAMNEFAYLFYIKKDVNAAFQKYVASNYVQHNPDVGDGRDTAIAALTPIFASSNTDYQIARVMVGPEYTTLHTKAVTEGSPDYNVFDVFKTQGTCIIEHWDALQEMRTNTTSTHPYF